MPCHHIKWRVIDECRPEPAKKLRSDLKLAIAVFKLRHRRLEVSRIRKPVCSDRAKLRQPKRQSVVFADVPSCLLLRKNNPELDAARNHADLSRRNLQDAHLRVEPNR